MEPRLALHERLSFAVAQCSAGRRSRQRLQDPVGDVPKARFGRRAVPLRSARGRKGRAARRAGLVVLEGEALARGAGPGDITDAREGVWPCIERSCFPGPAAPSTPTRPSVSL